MKRASVHDDRGAIACTRTEPRMRPRYCARILRRIRAAPRLRGACGRQIAKCRRRRRARATWDVAAATCCRRPDAMMSLARAPACGVRRGPAPRRASCTVYAVAAQPGACRRAACFAAPHPAAAAQPACARATAAAAHACAAVVRLPCFPRPAAACSGNRVACAAPWHPVQGSHGGADAGAAERACPRRGGEGVKCAAGAHVRCLHLLCFSARRTAR